MFPLIICSIFANAQNPGDPDPSFAQNGIYVDTLLGYKLNAYDVAIQPNDGKILVSGALDPNTTSNHPGFIARFETDGTLDASFGNNGVIIDSNSLSFSGFCKILVLPDGNIILAAIQRSNLGDIYLRKILANGNPDLSFGTNSQVFLDYGGVANLVQDALVQPDGKIVVCGEMVVGLERFNFYAVRFNADGTVDSAFGGNNNGMMEVDFDGLDDRAYAMVLHANGKIAIAGTASMSGQSNDIAMIRLDDNGLLDNTFGTNGKTTIDLGLGENVPDLIIHGNGYLVCGSSADGITNHTPYVARITADGSLDPTFGNAGLFKAKPENKSSFINAIALQSDGRILGVGATIGPLNTDPMLVRLNANGTLDSTFATNGAVFEDYGTIDERFTAMVLDSDGRLLAVGYSTDKLLMGRFLTGAPIGIAETGFTVNVMPNPTANQVHIALPENTPATITLYHLTGKRLKSEPLPHNQLFHLGEVSTGTYLLEVLTQNGQRAVVRVLVDR